MISKKLLSFDRKALRYVGLNVLFQWLGMLCNVVLVMTVSRLIGGVFAGSLNEGIILKAVRDECREKTVLLVSHRRSTMAVADLSFSVESGRLS